MANVTIVPPSAQVQTVAAAGGQQAKGQPALNLQPGAIVSGTIIGKDAGGNFLLRTGQGILSLQSNTPLTYNSDVVIQTGNNGAGGTTTARIISVNGEPFAAFAAPEPQTSDTVSAALQTQAPAPEASPAATALRAVIVAAPTAEQVLSNTQAGNDNSQPVSGTNVIIRLTSAPQTTTQQATLTTTPQPAAGASNQTGSSSVQAHTQVQQLVEDTTPANVAKLVSPQPTTLQQNTPAPAIAPQTPEEELASAPAATPQEPSPAAPALPSNVLYATYTKQANVPAAPASAPAGTPPPATTDSPIPAAPAAAGTSTTTAAAAPAATSNARAAPSNTLQGQVTATNSDARTATIQTPIGAVIVKADPSSAPALLLPGTNVTIELPANSVLLSVITQTPLSQALLSSAPAPLSELASSWQSLGEIISLVQASNAPAAAALLARLPQSGPNFIASTTSFVAALTGGNVRKLLGDDAVEVLRQNGRLDLLQKFTGEMNNLSEAYASPGQRQTTAWQPLFLPFVYQEELQQARLYVKREPPKKGGKNNKSTGDTRFVVEVDLSELGPMQMDGLVRDRQQSKAFDLIIRSRIPFSAADQAEISDIYNNAAELTGFKGTITFQVSHDFPVKPLDEMLADASRSITV